MLVGSHTITGKCPYFDWCVERRLRDAKKMKHWGVFEFADFTVSVSGVSRALTHQLVRHRLFSYLQQSQRAVEIDVDSDWYATPDSIRKSIYAEEYDQLMERIEIFYGKLTKTAIKDEDTRFVLPNATKTHITIKGNARNWLHFFKMRLDPHAQWEIREMAQKILEEFMKLSPIIFEGAGELEV
jgi:thymidylate synthase (FAD)